MSAKAKKDDVLTSSSCILTYVPMGDKCYDTNNIPLVQTNSQITD